MQFMQFMQLRKKPEKKFRTVFMLFFRLLTHKLRSQLRGSFFIWFHFRSSHIWFISYTFVTVQTLAGFLKTPNSWNGPFFPSKNYLKVAIIKTKSATIAFFLIFSFRPPRSLFLSCFSFVSVILELMGLKKPVFWLKWLQISLGWFSNWSVR